MEAIFAILFLALIAWVFITVFKLIFRRKSKRKNRTEIIEVSLEPEKHLKKEPIKLKNTKAESLRKKGYVIIDGIEIKLWQQNNQQTIKDQLTWNKLSNFTELNTNSTGENGNIILTGVFQIPRKEVANYATKLNFKVRSDVSKFTDYIVIGTENVSPSKIAKAIQYNKKGANIKIITEDTFLTLISKNLQ